jgi:hypothetical protein
MAQSILSKTLIFCLFFAFFTPLSMAQNRFTDKQFVKVNIAKFQFADPLDFVGQIDGYSLGVTYELLLSRHWSMSGDLEYATNDNIVKSLMTITRFPDLPKREHRFAFLYDFRYYFKKAGSGFYVGNAVGMQRVYNDVSYQSCNNGLCPPYYIHKSLTIIDRLSVGYQTFFTPKTIVGISLGYGFEYRVKSYGHFGRVPQIAIHFGLVK